MTKLLNLQVLKLSVCLGERPGLVTAESMSAYMAYKPTAGMPESRRTVVSTSIKVELQRLKLVPTWLKLLRRL